MTAPCMTPVQHPARIIRRHAAGYLAILMLMLWLCDLVAGGSNAFAQNIVSTPSALSLTVAQGGTVSGTVSLSKSSTEQHSYLISANQSWTALNPPYGSTQTITTETDSLTVTVNTSAMGLGVGTYSGVVYIGESGGGTSTLLRIPVSLSVLASGSVTPPPPPPATTPPSSTTPPPPATTPPPPPSATPPPPTGSLRPLLQAFPAALALTAAKGNTASGVFNLQKSSTQQSSYSISANQSWTALNPPYGSTQTITTEVDPITVTVNTSAMNVGSYTGVVYIVESGPNGSQTLRIPVSLSVLASGSVTPPPPPPATTPPSSTTPPPPATTPPPPPSATPPPPTGSLRPLLQAFPAALALTAAKGNTASGVFNLQKSSTQQSSYSISANQSWTALNPPYGSTQTITTEVDPITVTVNTSAMNVGSYTGVVYIVESGPNGSQTLRIPVSLSVLASGSVTPPPPPPAPIGGVTSPPPPPAGTSTGTVTVMWNANTEADLQGYRVYVGTRSGARSQTFDVGNVTSTRLTLPLGSTYFFVVTAYDKSGNESSPSGELSRSLF